MPPTPSSSSLSISSPRGILPNSKTVTPSNKTHIQTYGSVLSTPPYLDTEHVYGAHESHLNLEHASSYTTTVGQDNNDEGLYLMWTHELLRERGFTPISCRSEVDEDEEDSNDAGQDSDCQSTDSSVDNSPESYRPQFLFSPAPSFLAESSSSQHYPQNEYTYRAAIRGSQEEDTDPVFSLARLFSLSSFCCFR
ncbi:hypothetical protein PHYBLDRAFT_173255 [Phycomyces blakesleeanus NRRL 1555(-)]|uniref:Uncharacterized protein n=1 Tax=Phycomyces blakesleeanus (strain ATCC 8743b / DSM 1359 / FGSC 10004 / NBRC 33097 / NRRL 1555) TaxID=763407 RepID=A0A167KJN6_PHYB8|nr:hypothetical protein PHYBLDRAFT_173255 [Phycomyces blakesleeanus NRRL 1555(-)]OAD68247.1 hypothetical protein PHYBLDRAFT_173255 [Phycomyces blakesleeanus NRRL 1555(-)]|eukprot:XP_018286287.1 hypothetical protein PHYBLDRAFT_173255 [Phycomyces blakesleeanus NRRL 1555(-)]